MPLSIRPVCPPFPSAVSVASGRAARRPLAPSRAVLAFCLAGTIAAPLAPAQSPAPYPTAEVTANAPMGTAKGIHPGRVVWVHNTKAVNQDCTATAPGHGWFLPENHNQAVVDAMVSSALQDLTGETSDRAAWSAVFRYHNATRGKGAVDYRPGEKVFIKINATSAYAGNFNSADLTPRAYTSETSIASVRAVLRQLVNVVGVAPRDIYVGDPLKHIYKHLYDVWHAEFPEVHYLDNGGYTNLGRENVVPSSTAVIRYSDHGGVLRTNVWSNGYPGDNPVTQDTLYRIFEEAEYLLNIPMLKGHRRAGVTMFAKNHFGSHTRADASHLHNGLVAPTEAPYVTRSAYGLYRVQVDLMGHSLLGRKNLLYLMDALWATGSELDPPLRWQMPPFANTYTASLFASLDPVAIESVGYDFLRSEFTASRVPLSATCAQMDGADDYLHQAADRANWPATVQYDPDGTGNPLPSLGTHEHWNNATARQYSRNLSATGAGIELVTVEQALRVQSLASQSVLAGSAARFTVQASGTPPLQYQWLRQPAGTVTWEVITDDASFSGATTATLVVASSATTRSGDQFRCSVTDLAGTTVVSSTATLFVTLPGAGRLVNLAARAGSGRGNRVAIGGFVISGAEKRVLIRAVGPTLTSRGIAAADVLRDPVIELHDALHDNRVIATGDDWGGESNATEILAIASRVGAASLAPDDRTSSALLLTLPPGPYSFLVRGGGDTTGIVLVEVYDADLPGSSGRLVDLAARAQCGGGTAVTVGGFVVEDAPKRVLVRAVGPSLSQRGISAGETLSDPVLEVHDTRHDNAVIARNDDWSAERNAEEITATAASVGAAALASDDRTSSALLLDLQPGVYSFIAQGKADASGIVLIEVYEVQ
jgi:hypothetical protein